MAGTKEGGKKASATNRAKYGKDFYKRIGSEGGKKGTTGGFWYAKYVKGDIESVRAAGRSGGAISTRTHSHIMGWDNEAGANRCAWVGCTYQET